MPLELVDFAGTLAAGRDFRWACQNFDGLIRDWIEYRQPKTFLEIGGGRTPLLLPKEISFHAGMRYIVNDISDSELARLDDKYERARFDVQSREPLPLADGSCDLITAKMVFEHLSDPQQAYRNIHALLRPGGCFFSLMPTLFSPPFVANWILPEKASSRILQAFYPRRNDDEAPKFPAYYRWCRASSQYLSDRLRPIGFASVGVIPFYGHDYFRRIPIVRSVDDWVRSSAAAHGRTRLASYAYVIAGR